jgi:hypothetical protein
LRMSFAGRALSDFTLSFIADGQLGTAFGASSFQDDTAISGGHTGSKSMGVFSFPVAWLVRTFHFSASSINTDLYFMIFQFKSQVIF